MMPWSTGDSGNAAGSISEAASIGVTRLLAMKDGQQTLLQFLAGAMEESKATLDNPASVCFTGHSLGGALAPTLALYMRNNQGTWDPQGKAVVTTISFAGPSAGDAEFASYFDAQFGYTGRASRRGRGW